MPPPSQNAVRTWHPPGRSLPTEILSIIFLLVVEDEFEGDRVQLMLVCRRWYAIMRSTPRIPSALRIRKSTTAELVRVAIEGTQWLLNVTIDIADKSIGQCFNEDAFEACFMAAIEAASRWQSLAIYSLPRRGKYMAFQAMPPLENLEYICLSCSLGCFLEPLMTAITTTATPRLRNMTLRNLSAVLYLMQPNCLHVFCSLVYLTILLPKRMDIPANILPHLQRLNRLEARHLHLPFHPPDAPLPLIQTLRYLALRSVSVQWMAGKVFPVLWFCSITFPHHIDTICLQPVTMPACTHLTYDSNDLNPLRYFHDLPLAQLAATSSQWNVARGNSQLITICHIIVPHAQGLTTLDVQVRCSAQLLTYMLRLLPALKNLCLRLASPHALSEIFFQAFVATKSNADRPCEMGAPPRLSLCSNLAILKVNYQRWLRGPERTQLLLVFGDIVSSRNSEEGFQLRLSFEGLAPDWCVERHAEGIHEVANGEPFVIGISSPHGIIPIVMSGDDPFMAFPFKAAEDLVPRHEPSLGCLLTFHHLVELRVRAPSEPLILPLFHTLRVLVAENINPSFLAGQTFYKLERCRISLLGEGPEPSEDQVTQMPVCTRLDVNDLPLLGTLKLPQICELGVLLDHPEFNMIWETHVAVNANLSGLEVLHVHGWHQQVDVIRVLRCLPALKSLILGNGWDLDANFFGKFVPMSPNGTSRLKHSHDERQISAILCPMLRRFLVEDFDSTEQLELIPLLKEIVIQRSVPGSSLKKLALFDFELGSKFKLIWSYGDVVVKKVSLSRDTQPFSLDI